MVCIMWSAAALCVGITSFLEGGMEWRGVVTGMSTVSTSLPQRIDENILNVLLVVFEERPLVEGGVTVILLG